MISLLGTPELDLVVARPLHVAGHRHELGPGRGLGADLGVLAAAHPDDVRHGRERLNVVDQRRTVVEALDRRERRLQPRVAALALERVEQPGLLAADVGAGAAVQDKLEKVARAGDVAADVARLERLGDRRLENVGLVGVLAADVDEGAMDLGRPGRDHDPLDQHVRALLHQLAVLERARLGLVGVADEVLLHVAAWQEATPSGPSGSRRRRGRADRSRRCSRARRRAPSTAPSSASRSRPAARRPGACSARARRCGRTGASSVGARVGAAAVAQLLVLEHRTALRRSSMIRSASSSSSGPTYSPLTEAIGAMSHAPRHSNERTSTSGCSAAAASIASKKSSAPRSEHEMLVQTYTSWCLGRGSSSNMS